MTDIAEVLVAHFPGVVVQANLTDAIAQWLAVHGAVTDDDVPAILAAANSLGPPAYPLDLPSPAITLPRFPLNNPAPDGWSVGNEMEVPGGLPR